MKKKMHKMLRKTEILMINNKFLYKAYEKKELLDTFEQDKIDQNNPLGLDLDPLEKKFSIEVLNINQILK